MRSPRVYAIQNGIAASLFFLLLVAESLAYLLNYFPRTEMLWMLTISANRIAGPFLGVADRAIQLPFALLGILAIAIVIPILAYRRRSWFGTAVSGHVALGVCVMLSYELLRREHIGHQTASLSKVFVPGVLDGSAIGLIAVTMVMGFLCLLNHFMFFAQHK